MSQSGLVYARVSEQLGSGLERGAPGSPRSEPGLCLRCASLRGHHALCAVGSGTVPSVKSPELSGPLAVARAGKLCPGKFGFWTEAERA